MEQLKSLLKKQEIKAETQEKKYHSTNFGITAGMVFTFHPLLYLGAQRKGMVINMKKMVAGVQRVLSLMCGLGALMSLGSLFEGGLPLLLALSLSAGLALAARALSLMALRSEQAARRARRRRDRAQQRRVSRRAAAAALAASHPVRGQGPAADLRVA